MYGKHCFVILLIQLCMAQGSICLLLYIFVRIATALQPILLTAAKVLFLKSQSLNLRPPSQLE